MSEVYYQCQRCANCCKWPGEVPVSDEEVAQIASFMQMPEKDFIDHYTILRRNRQGLTLTEKANGECVFLDGIDCRINPVKPSQCRDFPNQWNFPGWRKLCEAIPIELPTQSPGVQEKNAIAGRRVES